MLCVQERERQTSGSPREVAELQQQLQLKERERESLVEQMERNQEELESEREEKETGQQELVRQIQLCFITIFNTFLNLFFYSYLTGGSLLRPRVPTKHNN